MTSLTQVVAKNTLIQVIGRLASLFLGVIVIGMVMRYLGPVNYGYYSTAMAFLQIIGIIADFGLYLITLQYLGEIDGQNLSGLDRQKQTDFVLNNILTLRILSAIFFYGAASFLAIFFPYPAIVKWSIFILSGSLFFHTLIQIYSAIYQKFWQAAKIVWGELAGRLVLLGLVIIFVWKGLGLYYILLAFVISAIANFIFLRFRTRGLVRFKLTINLLFWKKVIQRCWPIGLSIFLNALYFKIDTIILSFYHTPIDVGLYGACYRVFEILITFPPLFLGLIMPLMSQAWFSQDRQRFQNIFQKSFNFLIMLAIPLVVFVLLFGPKLMVLIGGKDFLESGKILRIIILATGVLFVAELFKQIIVSLNQQRTAIWLYFITSLIAIIGYFIFVPRYSYWGAAWTTFIVEILMLILMIIFVGRKTNIWPQWNFAGKALVASLFMGTIIFLWQISLWWAILVAIIIYFGVLYLLGAINWSVWRSIFGS